MDSTTTSDDKQALETAKASFALYGFTASPLTDPEILQCVNDGVDPYGVGCDVAGGYSFAQSLEAAKGVGQ